MALIGSTVDPRMFVQDYSGFANAAAIRAAGMMNLGNQIGGAIADYSKQRQELKKQQSAMESEIKIADSIAGLIETKMPDLIPGIGAERMKLNDRNLPLEERYAGAQYLQNALQLGITMQQAQFAQNAEARAAARAATQTQNNEPSWADWGGL